MTTIAEAAARVKAWLVHTNRPAKHLATESGVDDKVIREALNGTRWNPTLKVLEKLEALVPLDWSQPVSAANTKKPSELIELLGGPTVVSGKIKKPFTTVASWAARESIPVAAWPPLLAWAAERGIEDLTYEVLVQIHVNAERVAGKGQSC